MDDKDIDINELKRQLCSGNFRIDIKAFWLEQYAKATSPKERDKVLLSLWNWSLSQPWAWGVFVELCRRTPKLERKQSPPQLLVDFAMMAVTGERKRPKSGPGHPVGDINEDADILATVRVLTKAHGYSKSEAYREISEWLKDANLEPGAVRKRVRKLETAKPFPSKHGRK